MQLNPKPTLNSRTGESSSAGQHPEQSGSGGGFGRAISDLTRGFLKRNPAACPTIPYTPQEEQNFLNFFAQGPLSLEDIRTQLSANPNLAKAQDEHGNTALHLLMLKHYNHDKLLDTATWLANCGADVKLPNSDGKTPLDVLLEKTEKQLLAGDQAHPNLLKLALALTRSTQYEYGGGSARIDYLFKLCNEQNELLDLIIKFFAKSNKQALSKKDQSWRTPLSYFFEKCSTHKDFKKILVLLIALGADFTTPDNKGWEPIKYLFYSSIRDDDLLNAVKILATNSDHAIKIILDLIILLTHYNENKKRVILSSTFKLLIEKNGVSVFVENSKDIINRAKNDIKYRTAALASICYFIREATNPKQLIEIIKERNADKIYQPLSEDCPYPPLFCAIALSDHAGFKQCLEKDADLINTTDNLPDITAADFYIELNKNGLITQEFNKQLKKIQM